MFLILALPRSRTYWLSQFLSYGDYSCGHEEARYLRSLADAKTWLAQDFCGSAETALAPFWRLIDPAINIVVVRRPVADVVRSFMALDLRGVLAVPGGALRVRMEQLDAKLRQISKRLPHVLSVDYADLDKEEGIRAVWKHCLPYPFDAAWWAQCRAVNMQCNMRALARYAIAYRGPIDRMAKMAAAACRTRIVVRPPQSSEGVTFQQEGFAAWIRDGVPLFEQHLVEVGEAPDNWKNKDLPLMKMMYDAGYMQITTARANGRMFGYLMAVINPDLEMRGEFTGLHNTFYVSKDMPGIGVKLQRASVEALKARGARAALFYAGVRGDGPRMSALYRRLGAEEFGSLYRLELGAF